ncbi:hypothetical protein WEH80_07515 [Actinomycetes bacterium KLBMP 9759]
MDTVRLLALALVVGFAATTSAPFVPLPVTDPNAPSVEPIPPTTSGPVSSMALLTEVYGDGAATATARLNGGLANGVSIHPPLSRAERPLVAGNDVPFVYFSVPSEAGVGRCYPETTDEDTARTLADLGRTSGWAWRLGSPEFDQGGGCWAEGRPSPDGLADADVLAQWLRYYRETRGLDPAIGQPAAERGYQWMSLCAYAFCPQYAFELGSDAVLLERNNDEISAMSPGLSFVRGAARQAGDKVWGVDMSTYRYWTGGPTVFDENGTLLTGWSPSTFERHMYAAYMAGADIILNEAADYTTGGPPGGLNPLGATVRAFADFSLNRHADRGAPHVPMAVVQDHASGYEPRFGEFEQAGRKWYRHNPYTAGDRTLDGMLALAFPGHETWGTIPPGAPWEVVTGGTPAVGPSQAAQRQLLASGADPRQWEPMGSTRWGESLDVLTDRASLDTLLRYPVVVLATSTTGTPEFTARLQEYARRGGTLVVSAALLPADAQPWTGVAVMAQRGESAGGIWAADGGAVTGERPFGHTALQPAGAQVVATTSAGAPLITRNAVGSGAVYVTAVDHMVDAGGRIDAVDRRLLDELQQGTAKVAVAGPPLQYLVTSTARQTVITLINTDVTGQEWNGTLRFRDAQAGTLREWTSDTAVGSTGSGDVVEATVSVPPYGVRVVAVDNAG